MRAAQRYAILSSVLSAPATDQYLPCGGTETARREHHRPHRARESQTALRPSVLALLVYILRQSSLQC